MSQVLRPEYPRPLIVREEWMSLNGSWGFAFDDDDRGVDDEWYRADHRLDGEILVPYPFEAKASGIGDSSVHKVVWYRSEFSMPNSWQGRRLRLHFGAVDYQATVWVNGHLVGSHRGGYTAFWFDITRHLSAGENVITVRVFDELTPEQPRGKQVLTERSRSIFYTRCTGIWQTVWLEPVHEHCIEDVRVDPDLDRHEAIISIRTSTAKTAYLDVQVRCGEHDAGQANGLVQGGRAQFRVKLDPFLPWSPSTPNLYDLELELSSDKEVLDQARSYCGLRAIGVSDGLITLNGEPCYQKLVLDQSYWPDGVYTAPSDQAIREEVEWVLRMGFNGVRKHQVSSDPRFLYWADRLGLLVWQDMPGQTISLPDVVRARQAGQAEANLIREWSELIRQARGHPSIIVWVPFNESWGLYGVSHDAATRAFMLDVVRLTKDLDPDRLVVGNDGWEHLTETDIFALHDYATNGEELLSHLQQWGRPGWERTGERYPLALIPGERYVGQPLILSEYGGLALVPNDEQVPSESWGYGRVEPDATSFLGRYHGLQAAIAAEPRVTGYCYTQLTDVEQEINGLLSFHRSPKVDPDEIRRLNDMVTGPGAVEG